jgi:acyl carrier protein
MLPAAFVLLEALPLTPHGKIDCQALPAPEATRAELRTAFVAPSTPIERDLAMIWCELLGIDRVGIYDNFFELGGHSLLATQVLARIRAAFQIELPLQALFSSFTIAELAQQIAQRQIAPGGAEQITALLERLDQLSDEDVEALLARNTPLP